MTNENKALVAFGSYLKDLNYSKPKISSDLNKPTVKAIDNALGEGIVDDKGRIWICAAKLHTVFRVKTKNDARFLLQKVSDKDKATYDGSLYVRWASLISIVTARMERNPKNRYLNIVCDAVKLINECNDIMVLRLKSNDAINKSIKTLKRIRIKEYTIKKDELTGKLLNKTKCEFSHIRSVTMYPDYALFSWNGLIVNHDIHKVITSYSINDEDELYALCYKNGWYTNWYSEYKNKV